MGQGLFKSSYFYDLKDVKYTPEQKQSIEGLISKEPLLIFSKSYCPYCVSTKSLLHSHGVTTAVYREVNKEVDGLETQAILYKLYDQKTVPSIFISGRHIGGNAELQKLAKEGKLKQLLDAARVPNSF